MEREWFAVILICSLCFNLAPAKRDCASKRDICLKHCDDKPYGGCRESCHEYYEICLRQNKRGHRRDYKRPNKRKTSDI
ncbi:hypothetical protein ScPMuIL_010128 [Solemya velum]